MAEGRSDTLAGLDPPGSPAPAEPTPGIAPGLSSADDPLDVVVEDERWSAAGLEELARRAGQATLDWLGMSAEIVVMGCDDARIAMLNADFRGKPVPTNVLSWPALDHVPRPEGTPPPRPDTDALGDIAIAYETCAAEARDQGKTLADHALHLLVHGILHLAGYDHQTDADAALMEQAERDILARLGVADPYQEPLR